MPEFDNGSAYPNVNWENHEGYAKFLEINSSRLNFLPIHAISQNLFVLDHETRTAFERCMYEMERRSISICAVETARGAHLYLGAAGVVQNIASGTLPDIEVRGTRVQFRTLQAV